MNTEAATPAQIEAWHMSLMWNMGAYLPVLRQLPLAEVREIAGRCGTLSLQEPLHLMPGERYEIAGWRSGRKLTGNEVVALLVSSIWLLAGDSEENGTALLLAFPFMKDALVLAQETEFDEHCCYPAFGV